MAMGQRFYSLTLNGGNAQNSATQNLGYIIYDIAWYIGLNENEHSVLGKSHNIIQADLIISYQNPISVGNVGEGGS